MGAPRIDATEVKEVVSTSIDNSVITSNMIDTAHVIIDAYLLGVNHPASLLTKIELYLSAHFVSITDQGSTLVSSKTGDSTDAWDLVNLGKGFNATPFGQQALALDSSGILSGIGTGHLKAQFRVV